MHTPVLYQEIMDYLQPIPGGYYIDGTVGGAGHAEGLLEASSPDGRLLAFDRDPEAIIYASKQLRNPISAFWVSPAAVATVKPNTNLVNFA